MHLYSVLQSLSLIALIPEVLVVAQQYPIKVLHEFSNPTWLDSNAVRYNGDVLVTSATTNEIRLIKPSNPEIAVTVASIPGGNGANGITEMERDVFYINGGNFTVATGPILGSYGVWRLDFRQTPPVISLVTRLPDVRLANGIARLHPTDNSHVLISDPIAAEIIRVNVKTGEYARVINDTALRAVAPNPNGVSVLRTSGSYVYFNNQGSSLQRIPFSTTTGIATGPSETIVTLDAHSFAISTDGTKAWMSSNFINSLQEIDIVNRTSRIVVQNQPDFITPTGVALGTEGGKNVLYITTGGGLVWETMEAVTGGRLIQVNLEV
ncbi:Putative six-bladed beta-propeller, TolB [Colletotrichum destructivum]|uniref:Six-bladed beta-propeller, TolB n=1 Tax=Colletotrichum destructivum TaxID=34406 RepID=A0AAX4J488_9PEZI|nr:Putative six-bladed beta-propeller, TolB [Colletotrichum destructivum]